jgi:superoxide dismutase, Fe-Mn family
MPVILPELPFPKDSLEPYISAKTLDFHYGKHHSIYVMNTNKLVENTDLEKLNLEEIIIKSYSDSRKIGIFNNAAQVWNHSFYWKCIQPNGGNVPTGKIAERINLDFFSYQKFADEFKNAAVTHFGSGWVWLVLENKKLKIIKTSNADTPLVHNLKPLLTIDVWEHAYYLDYQNRRPDYVTNFIDKLINWDFVNFNFEF